MTQSPPLLDAGAAHDTDPNEVHCELPTPAAQSKAEQRHAPLLPPIVKVVAQTQIPSVEVLPAKGKRFFGRRVAAELDALAKIRSGRAT